MVPYVSTTDGMWVKIGENEWWFTKGISAYPESLVDLWLKRHPGVGIMVVFQPTEA